MRILKPKSGLRLHKIGSKYMIVDASCEDVNLTNVYSLNETAAWIWEKLSSGTHTAETLAEELCKEYDVEKQIAQNDINRQLQEWSEMGLLQNP